MLQRPAHCEMPDCTDTRLYQNGRVMMDGKPLWLCHKHRTRWIMHRRLTLGPQVGSHGPKPHPCNWPGCSNARPRVPSGWLADRCPEHRGLYRRRTQ